MTRRGLGLLAIIPLFAVAGCGAGNEETPPDPPPPGAIAPGTVLGTAAIEGRVHLRGTPPRSRRFETGADPYCEAHAPEGIADEAVVVNADGTLRNVFIHVASGLQDRVFAWPEESAVLDQAGCVFRPRVLGVQMNQPVRILNSDDTFHNVNRRGTDSRRRFNVGLAKRGESVVRWFKEPEIMIEVHCDVHSWMTAWIGVVPHPYFAVTGAEGTYRISGLPAGAYVIESWHEEFGTVRQQVELRDGEARTLDFDYAPR